MIKTSFSSLDSLDFKDVFVSWSELTFFDTHNFLNLALDVHKCWWMYVKKERLEVDNFREKGGNKPICILYSVLCCW